MAVAYQRYAIYFAPDPESDLAAFARGWLGVDAETGVVLDPPTEFVESPRKYGFHATLKAPMRLAPGFGYEDLRIAVADLASKLKPVSLGQLRLQSIGPFLALAADRKHHDAVSDLAFQCVHRLDRFRAALNEAERDKRKNLTDVQKDNLERWGYPYVGEQFRFHMTLTSSLNEEDHRNASALLAEKVPVVQTSLDSIAIFGDPGASTPFHLIERFRLQG